MNRMHPGIPPSRRRQWQGDWKERLGTTTRSLATRMRDTFEFDDPTTRRILIAGVRLALGEATEADLKREVKQAAKASDDGERGAVAVTAQAFRIILDGDGVNRGDPFQAESFMSVVERALDEMGLGWREKVRTVARMAVEMAIHPELSDGTDPRRKVLEAAREALGPSPSREFAKVVGVPGLAEDERIVTSMPGMFRVALDAYELDYRDPGVGEAVMAEVVAVLDAELEG